MTILDPTEIAEQLADRLRPLRILRAKDAAAKLGVSRAQFYEVRKTPGFPHQVSSEATGVAGYWEHELDEWMRESYQ